MKAKPHNERKSALIRCFQWHEVVRIHRAKFSWGEVYLEDGIWGPDWFQRNFMNGQKVMRY